MAVEAILANHGATSSGIVPVGAIIMWSGSKDAIPDGWALCDGTIGTPDLRGRFVVGAGGAYAVGNTGGEETHRLTVGEMPSHSHTMLKGHGATNGTGISWDYNHENGTLTTNAAGSGYAHENRPPYYALCYIMRVT